MKLVFVYFCGIFYWFIIYSRLKIIFKWNFTLDKFFYTVLPCSLLRLTEKKKTPIGSLLNLFHEPVPT